MIVRTEPVLFPLNDYPTSDGKPMAETDHHRKLMTALIQALDHWFAADPAAYVSGNLLLFYEKGDKRRHIAPDVFVIFGVPKGLRPNFLIWEEKKTPDVVIELTSKTTKAEDTTKKWRLYEEKLKVKEYFLFDPYEDYLAPSFQGYRRVRGKFQPIAPAGDRLPSDLLRLHLERDGIHLRLWDPATGERVLTPEERAARESTRADRAEAEAEQLRRELAELRRRQGNGR
jgi:Uma2 family endonuclease